MQVLLVDDDADLREVVAESLALDGHEVYPAGSLDEARATAAHWRPDVVILDLLYASTAGTPLREVAEPHDWGGALLVLTSGSSDTYLAAAADRLGAAAVLRKPYDLKALRDRLLAARRQLAAGGPEGEAGRESAGCPSTPAE